MAISLLGPFRVTLDGNVLENFSFDSAQALLAYLAMKSGIIHDRETLAALLWPDCSRSDGLRNLRQTLRYLRDVIDDRGTDYPFLRITRHKIQVNPLVDYWLDVAVVESLVKSMKGHRHRRLEGCRFCIDRLEQALDLYRGDFMAGFFYNSVFFEEWLIAHQRRFHMQMVALMSQLTLHYQRLGAYERAYYYARRQTELEPWEDEGHRQVIKLLALKGERSAALAHYEAYKEALMNELGVQPMPETTELSYQIRRGKVAASVDWDEPDVMIGMGTEDRLQDDGFAPQHNLPFPTTPFVGREEELSRLFERLLDPSYRLICLVGPGGVGKTRLALVAAQQVIKDFSHGVWFIHLSDYGGMGSQQDVIAREIAKALGLTPTNRQSANAEVLAYLRDKELLLLLDNVEHLIDEAVEFVTELLPSTPGVTVLVTSRERLNLQAEIVVPLMGLPVPASAAIASAETYASVRLFAERAERTVGDFVLDDRTLDRTVRICRALEGYPLGIELAAAWMGRMELDDIASLVERDLTLLETKMRDLPLRHRSMRAVFEGSWDLLGEDERAALVALSVFSGTFDQVGGIAVAETDEAGLRSLVDKSLLYRNTKGRYIWHELIRQFTVEKLEQSPQEVKESVRQRYAEHYLRWVSERVSSLKEEGAHSVIAEIRMELDNIQQAWRYAVSSANFAFLDQVIDDVMYLYHMLGLFKQGEAMLGEAVSHLRMQMERENSALTESQHRLGRLLVHLAHFLNSQSKHKQARMVAETALGQFEEVDDPFSRAAAYLQLGKSLGARGQLVSGQESIERALAIARENGFRHLEAEGVLELSDILLHHSSYAEADEQAAQALLIYRDLRDRRGEAMVLKWMGDGAVRRGDYSQAWEYYTKSRQVGHYDLVNEQEVALRLGMVLAGRGRYEEAVTYFEDVLRSFRESGQRFGESRTLRSLGRVYLQLGDRDAARNCLKPALHIIRVIKSREEEAAVLSDLGYLAQQEGQYDTARAYFTQAIEICKKIGNRSCEQRALTLLGKALMELKRQEEAEWAFAQAVVLQVEVNPQLAPLEAMAGMAQAAYADGRVDEALVWVMEILLHIERRPGLPETHEPFWIYWISYEVLKALKDPQAEGILEDAYTLMSDRAMQITSERWRSSYLDSTLYHRRIREVREGTSASE